MITFLTICYAAVLFLLIKLKVVKPSPIAYSTIGGWMLLLLILLFIPMQFFAPAGPLRVFSYVNQIVPNVSGQVIEVPIDPNQPLREGDVLFRIDPRPYQFAVDRLEASLADAGVGVSQLLENLRAAEATTAMARANVFATETDLDRRAREQVEAGRPDLLLRQVVHSQPAALLIQQGPVRTNFNGGVMMEHQRPGVRGPPK